MLDIPTSDLGFDVVHLVEYADDALKAGKLKLDEAAGYQDDVP